MDPIPREPARVLTTSSLAGWLPGSLFSFSLYSLLSLFFVLSFPLLSPFTLHALSPTTLNAVFLSLRSVVSLSLSLLYALFVLLSPSIFLSLLCSLSRYSDDSLLFIITTVSFLSFTACCYVFLHSSFHSCCVSISCSLGYSVSYDHSFFFLSFPLVSLFFFPFPSFSFSLFLSSTVSSLGLFVTLFRSNFSRFSFFPSLVLLNSFARPQFLSLFHHYPYIILHLYGHSYYLLYSLLA